MESELLSKKRDALPRNLPHRSAMKKTHLDFRITGLDPSPFVHLYGLSDSELGRAGIVRLFADAPVGYPDRIGMRDVQPGESVLLCHFEHLTLPIFMPNFRKIHMVPEKSVLQIYTCT